jgi:hypothetical protein
LSSAATAAAEAGVGQTGGTAALGRSAVDSDRVFDGSIQSARRRGAQSAGVEATGRSQRHDQTEAYDLEAREGATERFQN